MIRISREEMFIDEGKVRPKGSSTSKGGTMQQEDFVYRVPPTTRKPIGGMWPPLLLAVLVIECLLASWKQRFEHVLNNSWLVSLFSIASHLGAGQSCHHWLMWCHLDPGLNAWRYQCNFAQGYSSHKNINGALQKDKIRWNKRSGVFFFNSTSLLYGPCMVVPHRSTNICCLATAC